ncbi:MAG: hypothetical protein MZV64_02190 [Ignavibacteriales bacterium]|nr:hypothetical protein [Ignavibacteriales bacterium]
MFKSWRTTKTKYKENGQVTGNQRGRHAHQQFSKVQLPVIERRAQDAARWCRAPFHPQMIPAQPPARS